MSEDDEVIKVSLNKNKNDSDNKENDQVSALFVESLFDDIQKELKPRDPLNMKHNSIILPENFTVNLQQTPPPPLKTPQKATQNKAGSKNIPNTKSSKKQNYFNQTSNKKPKMYNSSYSAKYANNPNFNKTNTKNKTSYQIAKNAHSNINEKFKAKQESEKEKRLYQQKVTLLENRIIALKKQEEEMLRRKHFNDIKEHYLNQRKKEKNEFKQKLLSYDIDQRNELEERRKTIKDQKAKLNNELRESMEKTKNTKLKDYQRAQKEKQLVINTINKNNKKYEKYGKNNVNKIVKEREDFKKKELKKQKKLGKSMDIFYLESCEDNKQQTDKLKEKLKRLEKLEDQYINKINETRKVIVRNNSVGVYKFKKDMNPIKKLDLEENVDKKHTIIKRKNPKSNISKNLLHKSYDVNNDNNNINEENENNDNSGKVIKVETKIENKE